MSYTNLIVLHAHLCNIYPTGLTLSTWEKDSSRLRTSTRKKFKSSFPRWLFVAPNNELTMQVYVSFSRVEETRPATYPLYWTHQDIQDPSSGKLGNDKHVRACYCQTKVWREIRFFSVLELTLLGGPVLAVAQGSSTPLLGWRFCKIGRVTQQDCIIVSKWRSRLIMADLYLLHSDKEMR